MSGDKTRKKGRVKWFNASKGYGFITLLDSDGGGVEEELFAHQTAIKMDGFRTLDEGALVTFVVEPGPKGLQATDIRQDDSAPGA